VQQQLMPMSLGLKGMSARLPRCKLGPSQPTPVLYSAVLCCAVLCCAVWCTHRLHECPEYHPEGSTHLDVR
jgi:hypothetical protein